MKKTLFVLSELVFFTNLPIYAVLGGGAIYLLKLGKTPTGVEWSTYPAVALAMSIAVVGAICGYGAISATAYSWPIRAYMGGVWLAQVATNCIIVPIYLSASRMSAQTGKDVSFQEAVDTLLTAGLSGWVEWGAALAVVFTGELGLCGLLLVMAEMSKEKADEERKEEVRAVGEDRVTILDALDSSAYGMMTRKELEMATGLSYFTVDKCVRAMVDENVLESDGKTRNAKFFKREAH